MGAELDNYKKIVSEKFGIPIDLLDGDSVEETDSKALALMSYKEGFDVAKAFPDLLEYDPEVRKEKLIEELTPSKKIENREQFAKWIADKF